MSSDTRFLSLFTGAGGMDIGLEQAGWKAIYASDVDGPCVDTLQRNQGFRIGRGVSAFDNALVEKSDILQIDPKQLMDRLGIQSGEITLIAGGPPCQAWSSAGHQLGFNDPRGQLSEAYIRLAEAIRPKIILFENVRGLLTARGYDGRHGGALEHLRRSFLNIGYNTAVQLLNSADYGVPQRRVRLFLIAYQTATAPNFPIPTHKDPDRLKDGDLLGMNKWRTLGDCLENVEQVSEHEIIRPSAKLALQLEEIPDGKGLKSPGKKETTRPGGHWGYKQGAFIADRNRPSRTITASSQQDWIRDPKTGLRRLTPRECAAIQGFPVGWTFEGSRTNQYKQVGNAVPPPLARAIGSKLLEYYVQAVDGESVAARHRELQALPGKLQSAIAYSIKDHQRNGESRSTAPSRRRMRLATE